MGLGFTNPVGTRGVVDVCFCCGGVGSVAGKCVGGLDQGQERWCKVHPVFNPVAPYGYLLSDMYLFMADITNPDSFV